MTRVGELEEGSVYLRDGAILSYASRRRICTCLVIATFEFDEIIEVPRDKKPERILDIICAVTSGAQ